jgi:ribosomal silencing factor RsfS
MSADSQAPPIPWYLRTQREALRDTSEQQSARELIPELPPNPPPLLQTLLEYISITAGLDDLVLFDLRHLDPPPALGSKLIMIIGTARSEKHLHVSADRFCRYLRREHGLKANAAGLLGRNELKIKLRRKAKRMKMLANVGGREEAMGNLDDGIRTGWICCTIGRMEAHPDDTVIPGTDGDNFVGFRDVKPGVNVVVQMFTEEKRAEIDLETLWGGVLKTHERQDAMAEDQLKELEEHLEGVQASDDARILGDVQSTEDPFEAAPKPRAVTPPHPPSDANLQSQWTRPVPTRGDVFPPVLDQNAGHQLRRLHTVGLARGL